MKTRNRICQGARSGSYIISINACVHNEKQDVLIKRCTIDFNVESSSTWFQLRLLILLESYPRSRAALSFMLDKWICLCQPTVNVASVQWNGVFSCGEITTHSTVHCEQFVLEDGVPSIHMDSRHVIRIKTIPIQDDQSALDFCSSMRIKQLHFTTTTQLLLI